MAEAPSLPVCHRDQRARRKGRPGPDVGEWRAESQSTLEPEPTLPPDAAPRPPPREPGRARACGSQSARACVTQGLFIAELHQLQRHKQRGLSPYYYFNYHLN